MISSIVCDDQKIINNEINELVPNIKKIKFYNNSVWINEAIIDYVLPINLTHVTFGRCLNQQLTIGFLTD